MLHVALIRSMCAHYTQICTHTPTWQPPSVEDVQQWNHLWKERSWDILLELAPLEVFKRWQQGEQGHRALDLLEEKVSLVCSSYQRVSVKQCPDDDVAKVIIQSPSWCAVRSAAAHMATEILVFRRAMAGQGGVVEDTTVLAEEWFMIGSMDFISDDLSVDDVIVQMNGRWLQQPNVVYMTRRGKALQPSKVG